MSAPWSEFAGLVLLLSLFALLIGGRHLYVTVGWRRLYRAAARPLPGRTRDVAWSIDLADQPGEILSRPPRPYRPTIPGLPLQRSHTP